MWELTKLYSRTGRQALALEYVERLKASTDDPERQAGFYLAAGQLLEQMGDFTSAVLAYSQALRMEPARTLTWYLIHNNLGYSLNQLGRFSEAEAYCRAAIAIDPQRCNAYKNLGVALEGQGQLAEAARQYVRAVRANSADPRALRQLEKLVKLHPELTQEMPELGTELQQCQAAVKAVSDLRRHASNRN